LTADATPAGRARALEATASLNPGAFSFGDWGLFVSIALIWGSSFLFIAIALDTIEPGLITWGRVALGAAVLNVVPRARTRFLPEDRFRMVLLSLLWVGVPFTLFPLAEQHISSAVTGMLNGAMPIFAAIVAGVLLRTPPGLTQAAGLVVGLLGTLAVSLDQLGEGDAAWLGVLMALGATVCYGFAINIAAPLQRRYGSLAVMARMLALATIWTAPFGAWSVPGSSFALGPTLSVAFIGAVGTGIAFVIMATLVGSVGSTRAAMATYLIPVVAMVLGVVVRSERVGWVAVVGVALVVAGAYFASRPERVPAPTAVRTPT
jgi:drug/metabolite transporter (DMT)-like permease